MKKIVLLVSMLFASAIFAKPTGNRAIEIINGQPAADHTLAPSVVGLFVKYSGSGLDGVWLQWCTGSVLSPKLILTAAHCVRGVDPADVQINFSGRSVKMEDQFNPATRVTDVAAKFNTIQVKAIEIHPAYDGSGNHDLALMSLSSDAPESAVPVSLLPERFLDKANNQTTFEGQTKQVLLLGFGLISESPSTDTDILRSTTVNADFVSNLVVTDQTQGSGGCNGDSGGPAFTEIDGAFYQVGVTHGPHGNSTTCHETGEWVNPALDAEFLLDATKKLIP
jgi:secreted trypsin-like serine protease